MNYITRKLAFWILVCRQKIAVGEGTKEVYTVDIMNKLIGYFHRK
jgi:hypothetical protein